MDARLKVVMNLPLRELWREDGKAGMDDEISMLARFAFDMSEMVGKGPRPLVEQSPRRMRRTNGTRCKKL